MTACGSLCVRVKCSLTLSTCLPHELALQQNVRQDRKFQAPEICSACARCVELWSIECVRYKVGHEDSDCNKKAIEVLARRRSEILERCSKLFSFHWFCWKHLCCLSSYSKYFSTNSLTLFFFCFLALEFVCKTLPQIFYLVSKISGV